jgi:hypothetical protein
MEVLMRPTYALILALSFCSAALAQASGDGARGSTPPGMSQDGARPADGALKGGSILPGEQGGLPGKKDPAGTTSSERLQRCDEMTGVLRDDCLRKERSAAGGSSAPPERDRDNDERDLK